MGKGNGTFATKTERTDLTAGLCPYKLAVGDLNGDGKLDLAVANYCSGTVSVLLGTGNGGFGAKTDFATGGNPISVAIGDLNGDGVPDLAVTNSQDNTVSLLFGVGNGSFGAKTTVSDRRRSRSTSCWPI